MAISRLHNYFVILLIIIVIENCDNGHAQVQAVWLGFLPGGRFYQCGRVQVVNLVKLQKRGQILKLLVSDFEPLGGQRVNNVVGHLGVF